MSKLNLDEEKIKQLHSQGMCDVQISKYFSCCPESIRNIRKKYNLPPAKFFGRSKDLTGQIFGRLTVEKEGYRKKPYIYWLCNCSCGKTKFVSTNGLKSGAVKSCGCLSPELEFEGYEDISGSYWKRIIRGALGRGLEFNISLEYAWNLFEVQNRKCALSDLDLTLVRKWSRDWKLQTASLDRIKQDIGYVEGNVQWVHKNINWMKNSFDEDIFKFYCLKVSQKAIQNGFDIKKITEQEIIKYPTVVN